MQDKHEPRGEFIDRLQGEIAREVRRRSRPVEIPWWIPQTRARAAFTVAALVLVSMSLGAAGVAAAYQAQNGKERDALLSAFERRAALAGSRLKLAELERGEADRRVTLGAINPDDALVSAAKVSEAEAEVKLLQSQLEEIRLTGREPANEVTAPAVSGRDFVGERWRIEIAAAQAVHALEMARLAAAERRVALGIVGPTDALATRARVVEAEAAVEALAKKLELRQQFLARKVNAAAASLRALEIEAVQRLKTIEAKVELARKELERISRRVAIGTASAVDQAEAAVRVQQLETDKAMAELELARIRAQQKQKGR